MDTALLNTILSYVFGAFLLGLVTGFLAGLAIQKCSGNY